MHVSKICVFGIKQNNCHFLICLRMGAVGWAHGWLDINENCALLNLTLLSTASQPLRYAAEIQIKFSFETRRITTHRGIIKEIFFSP